MRANPTLSLRLLLFISMVIAPYALSCGDDDPTADPPVVDAGDVTDTAGDAPDGGDVTPDAVAEAPAPPVIVEPADSAEVASPVRVAGTGEVGAAVDVRVLEEQTEVGSQSGVVNDAGEFALSVAYEAPESGTTLTISVTLTNDVGTSDPTEVSVVHQSWTLSGQVSQTGGVPEGSWVHVRLFDDPDAILGHLQEVTVSATDGESLPDTGYSFTVANGEYYVRAFRDSGGPGGEADEQPTLGVDAQAPASAAIEVDGADASAPALELVEPPSGTFGDFDGYAFNQTAQARPPEYQDPPDSDNWVEGSGLCGGFYLFLQVHSPDASGVTPPRVMTPGGSLLELLDDGGCADAHDNSASSYDLGSDDGQYSYGLADPDDSDSGEYLFHYRDETLDLIHIESDAIDVVRLPRDVFLTAPTGAAAADPGDELTWDAVPGASVYYLTIEGVDDELVGSGPLTEPRFQPENPLADDSAFAVRLQYADATIGEGADRDAEAHTVTSYFFTDGDGDNTITISGGIQNDSGISGRVLVFAVDRERHARESSVVLPPDSTEFSLRTLAAEAAGDTILQATLDATGSGDRQDEGNGLYEANYDRLDGTTDIEQDIVFAVPPALIAPEDGASGVGDTPTLTWEDYTPHAPDGPWLVGLFLGSELQGGFPDIIWGLPAGATSFDMSAPPEGAGAYDLVMALACADAGGEVGHQECVGADVDGNLLDLSSATGWGWGVTIIRCDYQAYVDGTDDDENDQDDTTDCVLAAVMGQQLYATSGEWNFTTE